MKLLKSMPQDVAFFERYADLTHTLTKVSIITQVFTGVCEIGILYALIYPSVHDLAPSYAATLSTVAAVFLAAILQLGLKKVFPYSVKAFIYNRWKGLDRAFSIGVILLTIALLSVSVFLSYKGSKDIAAFAAPKVTEKTTTAQDSAKRVTTMQANAIFTTDSATIETKYKGKIEALTAELQSQIAAIERNAKGKQATTLRAELKTKLANLQSDKATEIQTKSDIRTTIIDRETSRADKQADDILSDNKTIKDKAETKANSYSGYIGYFTLFCYIFFLFTNILNEIHHKGAKIDLTPMPSQRHFNPSVLAEFFEAAKERIDVLLRTQVYNFANATAAQPLPDAVRALYDFKAKTFEDVLNVQPYFEQTKTVKLPVKRHNIAATIHDTKKIVDNTPQEKRYTIGFKQAKADDTKTVDDTKNEAITKIVGGGETIGQCPQCLASFTKNHKKHTYCSDECRKLFWENDKGKKLHKNKSGKN